MDLIFPIITPENEKLFLRESQWPYRDEAYKDHTYSTGAIRMMAAGQGATRTIKPMELTETADLLGGEALDKDEKLRLFRVNKLVWQHQGKIYGSGVMLTVEPKYDDPADYFFETISAPTAVSGGPTESVVFQVTIMGAKSDGAVTLNVSLKTVEGVYLASHQHVNGSPIQVLGVEISCIRN